MTSDEILAMKPGRALDAQVAEKVMGWTWAETNEGLEGLFPPQEFAIHGFKPILIFNDLGHLHGMPEYSTDITPAWEVAEKFDNMTLRKMREADGNVRHSVYMWLENIINNPMIMYKADTLPEAICKAALLAKDAQP